MQLIIMRHGEGGWHSVDQERELTDVGRHGAAAVAAAIGKSSWRPDRIWCSRSEEHTSELQSRPHLVCRLLLEKKKNNKHKSVNNSKHVRELRLYRDTKILC